MADSHRVNPALASMLVGAHELLLDPKNARAHPQRNLDAIAASLAAHGQQKAIIFDPRTKVVLAGNGTLLAARALGWTKVAAIPFDHADANSQLAFKLADNRSAELAEWDAPVLAESLRALAESGTSLAALGWTDEESAKLLQASEEDQAAIIEEIDFADLQDEFWLSVRGPLPSEPDVLEKLREALASVPGVVVNLGTSDPTATGRWGQ